MPPDHNQTRFLNGGDDGATCASAATEKYGRCQILSKAVPSHYPSNLPRHLRFLARTMALAIPSLFYIGPFMFVVPFFLYIVSPRAAAIALAVVISLTFVPVKQWPFFRHYFQLWYSLFDFHHNVALPLEPSAQEMEDSSLLIYSAHPHGVIPIHGYLWCAFCDQHFPSRYGFGALTSVAMRLPLLRHVMGWLSSEPAHKKILMQKMNAGSNLYILPGGVAEIFLACPGRHVIKAPRKGIMKLALQTGGALVPVYIFGANDFFSQLATCGKGDPKQSKCGQSSSDPTNLFGQIQRKLSRSMKAGFTFFWGQYCLPMPYDVKCSMVMGDPILPVPGTLGQNQTNSGNKKTCRQVVDPSEEQINELLHRYTDALIRLFEQYKAQAGYPDAELSIQ